MRGALRGDTRLRIIPSIKIQLHLIYVEIKHYG